MRSEKYKNRLVSIKRDLMKEVASLLTDGGFDMAKETPIYYYDGDSIVGPIRISFDYVHGDKDLIKLRKMDMPFACQISFDTNENITARTVTGEIMFLSTLLDYMNMDKKEARK